jgi:hypothetical protein
MILLLYSMGIHLHINYLINSNHLRRLNSFLPGQHKIYILKNMHDMLLSLSKSRLGMYIRTRHLYNNDVMVNNTHNIYYHPKEQEQNYM